MERARLPWVQGQRMTAHGSRLRMMVRACRLKSRAGFSSRFLQRKATPAPAWEFPWSTLSPKDTVDGWKSSPSRGMAHASGCGSPLTEHDPDRVRRFLVLDAEVQHDFVGRTL